MPEVVMPTSRLNEGNDRSRNKNVLTHTHRQHGIVLYFNFFLHDAVGCQVSSGINIYCVRLNLHGIFFVCVFYVNGAMGLIHSIGYYERAPTQTNRA